MCWIVKAIPVEDTLVKKRESIMGATTVWTELPNGQKHGIERGYFPNGNKEFKCKWKFGNLVGEQKFYHAYSPNVCHRWYCDENGRHHGPSTYYNQDGSVMRREHYYNGIKI